MTSPTTRPTVSVVIATHNRPELLRTAVAAVTDQDYAGDIECIIVFDQSEPDMSLTVDDPHRRVRVTANTERTPGLAGARNTGILAATGDYVAFCDDDDAWRPTKLTRQIDAMEAMPDALTSVTGITVNYGDHSVDRVPHQETFTYENVVRYRIMEGHPSSVLMRRDAILDRIGLVDEDLPRSYGEDYDYILRALENGPVAVVEEPLVIVLWGQSQFSTDWDSIVGAMDHLLDKHRSLRFDRRARARMYGRRAFANAGRGHRAESFRDIRRSLAAWPLDKRALVTIPAAAGVISAPRLLSIAHRFGRGI